jgi:hypothetical protein
LFTPVSLLLWSADRANGLAGAAINAKIGIDYIGVVALRNRADWALGFARAAADASVADFISHVITLRS